MNFITICENVVKLMVKYWDKFLFTGLGYTLSLAAITVFFGAILGSLIALLRMSKLAPFRWIAAAYTEIIRGTPMLLQLYLFYFGLPMLIPLLNKQQYACVAIALVCNSAAYVSEIIRSGIQAVDQGQTEASRSLGLSQKQTMLSVVLPQAVKNILPAIANEFVTIIKESSICYTIGVQEIMYAVNAIKGATFSIGEPLIVSAAVYFCLTFPTSKIIAYFERRMSRGDKR